MDKPIELIYEIMQQYENLKGERGRKLEKIDKVISDLELIADEIEHNTESKDKIKETKRYLEEVIADYEGQKYERPGDKISVEQLLVELKLVYKKLNNGKLIRKDVIEEKREVGVG